MTIQTRKQLMTQLAAEGLDDDELDLIRHELEMDPEADEYGESDEEMFSDDDRHDAMATSSTVRVPSSPTPPSRPPPIRASSTSTVPQKRKRLSKKKISPETIEEGEDVAGLGEHDCMLARLI
jgi:hypothetical protein